MCSSRVCRTELEDLVKILYLERPEKSHCQMRETVLNRVKQENSSCSWTAGVFCLSQQCSKTQIQMQLIIHAMHSITCSFMWSGVSSLKHLLQRDQKSLELFVGRREMEHHNFALVSRRITFLYRLKSKQNPWVFIQKIIPMKEREGNCFLAGILQYRENIFMKLYSSNFRMSCVLS